MSISKVSGPSATPRCPSCSTRARASSKCPLWHQRDTSAAPRPLVPFTCSRALILNASTSASLSLSLFPSSVSSCDRVTYSGLLLRMTESWGIVRRRYCSVVGPREGDEGGECCSRARSDRQRLSRSNNSVTVFRALVPPAEQTARMVWWNNGPRSAPTKGGTPCTLWDSAYSRIARQCLGAFLPEGLNWSK